MPTNRSDAPASPHAPFSRAAFFSIQLQRDPDATYAEVCRILAETGDAGRALAECSPLINGHGVEFVELPNRDGLLFVSKGDLYDATLCYQPRTGFFVSSVGDVREAAEREDDVLRHVQLETGHTLRLRDTGLQSAGRTVVAYQFRSPDRTILFEGEDFRPSPLHADDSDATLRALLTFLTLRPGDTDADYFAGYTAEQLAFAESSECEQLSWLYSEDGPGAFEDIEEAR